MKPTASGAKGRRFESYRAYQPSIENQAVSDFETYANGAPANPRPPSAGDSDSQLTRAPGWRCFHCGFETDDPKEAEAHFGKRDDEAALCLSWQSLDDAGRAELLRSTIRELNGEREDNERYRGKIEGISSEISSRFNGCTTINQAWCKYDSMEGRALLAEAELDRLRATLNTPEIEDFDLAVPCEAAHQMERWGAAHDAGKNPEDWFWLIGYLAGKALHAFKVGASDKALHHAISTAAACRNWHAHIRSGSSLMRPGISSEKAAVAGGNS